MRTRTSYQQSSPPPKKNKHRPIDDPPNVPSVSSSRLRSSTQAWVVLRCVVLVFELGFIFMHSFIFPLIWVIGRKGGRSHEHSSRVRILFVDRPSWLRHGHSQIQATQTQAPRHTHTHTNNTMLYLEFLGGANQRQLLRRVQRRQHVPRAGGAACVVCVCLCVCDSIQWGRDDHANPTVYLSICLSQTIDAAKDTRQTTALEPPSSPPFPPKHARTSHVDELPQGPHEVSLGVPAAPAHAPTSWGKDRFVWTTNTKIRPQQSAPLSLSFLFCRPYAPPRPPKKKHTHITHTPHTQTHRIRFVDSPMAPPCPPFFPPRITTAPFPPRPRWPRLWLLLLLLLLVIARAPNRHGAVVVDPTKAGWAAGAAAVAGDIDDEEESGSSTSSSAVTTSSESGSSWGMVRLWAAAAAPAAAGRGPTPLAQHAISCLLCGRRCCCGKEGGTAAAAAAAEALIACRPAPVLPACNGVRESVGRGQSVSRSASQSTSQSVLRAPSAKEL
jgi:hypothetical protein